MAGEFVIEVLVYRLAVIRQTVLSAKEQREYGACFVPGLLGMFIPAAVLLFGVSPGNDLKAIQQDGDGRSK